MEHVLRGRMAATETTPGRHPWPIVYGHRRNPTSGGSPNLAWALFLGLGLPFALMTVLEVLARGGIYVDVFRPLWYPWPPEVLKPFVGLAVFAVTLAYLAFRIGRRNGFRTGIGVGLASARSWSEVQSGPKAPAPEPPADLQVPPPPPDDDLDPTPRNG